jgi:hypothetical protein
MMMVNREVDVTRKMFPRGEASDNELSGSDWIL